MNSDSDSDWDSMSEAPPPPLAQGVQAINNNSRYEEQNNAQNKTRVEEAKKQERREEQLVQNTGKVKERKEQSNQRSKQPIPAKRSPSSKDSGIDTGTPMNAKDKSEAPADFGETNCDKKYVLEVGMVNTGFEFDSDDSSAVEKLGKTNFQPFPQPDERISLLKFDPVETKYFQVVFEDEGLMVDKAIPSIALCCSKVSAEILGLLKVPLVIAFVFVGQILRVLTSSILRPFSDHILKPLIVSINNLVLAPIFSLLYNISSMLATCISPCCNLSKYSPLYSYVDQGDNPRLSA